MPIQWFRPPVATNIYLDIDLCWLISTANFILYLINQPPCCLYTYIYSTDHTAALENVERISNENRTQIRQLEIQAHRAVQNINELANAQHSKSHPCPASVCLKIPTFQSSSGVITSH